MGPVHVLHRPRRRNEELTFGTRPGVVVEQPQRDTSLQQKSEVEAVRVFGMTPTPIEVQTDDVTFAICSFFRFFRCQELRSSGCNIGAWWSWARDQKCVPRSHHKELPLRTGGALRRIAVGNASGHRSTGFDVGLSCESTGVASKPSRSMKVRTLVICKRPEGSAVQGAHEVFFRSLVE